VLKKMERRRWGEKRGRKEKRRGRDVAAMREGEEKERKRKEKRKEECSGEGRKERKEEEKNGCSA
jgi:hypothetical protein